MNASAGALARKRRTIKGKINASLMCILIPALVILIFVSCFMSASAVSNLSDQILSAQSDNAVNQVDSFFTNKITAAKMYQNNSRMQTLLQATHTADTVSTYSGTYAVVKELKQALDSMSAEGVQAAWLAGRENSAYLMYTGEVSPP